MVKYPATHPMFLRVELWLIDDNDKRRENRLYMSKDILYKTLDETGDIIQDTSISSIFTLFDFHLRQDLSIYLPSNVETNKGVTRVFFK